jgi:N-acetylglucosaminyldiphosphoundecaprenol N-acetyl-beta-D-mannosaminyltransferase
MQTPHIGAADTGVVTGSGGMPAKLTVAETPISHIQLDALLDAFETPLADRARLVSFCNVHSVMSARRCEELAAALAASDIAAPDGMPVAWWIRAVHGLAQPRVFGAGTMDAALRHGVDRGWRHFFYGSTDETLAQLRDRVAATHPGAVICGMYAPPFRPLTDEEESDVLRRIIAARPTVLWVGLGMPKQELWMHRVRDRLPGMTLMGVGAAFDMLAGRVPQAPQWMRESGLEWVYRLAQEPRRLWRRYILNNPAFMLLLLRELAVGARG